MKCWSRTAPTLVCQSGSWGDRALAAYCRMHRNPRTAGNGFPYQSQRLRWEVCSNFGSWRILNKLYWSLAGSWMRYSKESGWPVLPRCCCLSSGAGWWGLQRKALGRAWWLKSRSPLSALYHNVLLLSCVWLEMAKYLLSPRDILWSWFSGTEGIKAAPCLQNWQKALRCL